MSFTIFIIAIFAFYAGRTPTNSTGTGAANSTILDVLPTIATILGTVFSVAFAFSQFVIPRIAEQYSPRILEFFRSDRKYQSAYFFLFISLVATVSLLLFSRILNPFDQTIATAAGTVLFTIVLIIFLWYYAYIYEVVDPLTFLSNLERRLLSPKEKKTNVEKGAKAFADSAIKALMRGGEEDTARAFVNSLGRLVQASLKTDIRPTDHFVDNLLNEMLRVYRAADQAKETSITRRIFILMREMSVTLIESS
jgi:hypothetical protein